MTGLWSLIKAEATQNYIPNPSQEGAGAAWVAYSTGTAAGSRTRGLTWQKRGLYGYRMIKSGGGASDHWGVEVACNVPTDFDSGESATFSVDLNVAASTTVTIEIEATVSGSPESTTLAVVASSVGRYSVTHLLTGDATAVTARVYIDSLTGTVDIDGLQVENKAYATSYCDGDQDGCKWLGAQHNSSSTRDKRTGDGGREFNLDSYGLYVEDPMGMGMPPLRHYSQFQAQQPGALWTGTTVDTRTFTLRAIFTGSTLANLHLLRKNFIDAIKEDAIDGAAFWLVYSGANSAKPIRVKVRYDTGLESGMFDGFSEPLTLRWIAFDPFWAEDGNTAAALSATSGTITTPYLGRRSVTDGWVAVAASLNGKVRAIIEAPDGTIYFGGDFTNAGGVANADYIARYDPETDTVTAMGTGMDGPVLALVAHPTGQIYAGGSFNLAGGVASTQYYARWTGSGWLRMVSVGNLFDDVVRALAVTPAGDIIVGGDFANANGSAYAGIVSNTLGVTENYTAMGTGTAGGDVFAIGVTIDGLIYAGGDFTGMGGVANTPNVAAWDGSAWVAMGTGVNGTVRALLGRSNGRLVIGGEFTSAGGNSGFTRIAEWNTINYTKLSSAGCDDIVRGLAEDRTGLLHVVGDFDSAGALDDNVLQQYAIWNDTNWLYPDGGPVGATEAYAVLVTTTGDVYIGSDDASGVVGSGLTTVANGGTRETYPVITISTSATGRLTWIENITTGAILYCDFGFLASSETLTIDLRPNRRAVTSNYRGLIWEAVKPGSDIDRFTLAPGDNVIAVRGVGASTLTSIVSWDTSHWSADGVAS